MKKQPKRGDPCTGCGRLGYYKLGKCLDCLKSKCPGCDQVKILRSKKTCSGCRRKKRYQRVNEI